MKKEKIIKALKSKKGKVILSSCGATILAVAIIATIALNIKPQREIVVKHGTLAGNVVTASDTAEEDTNTSASSTSTTKTDKSSGTPNDKSSDEPKDESSGKTKNNSSGKTKNNSSGKTKNNSNGRTNDNSNGKPNDKSSGKTKDNSSGKTKDNSSGKTKNNTSGKTKDNSSGKTKNNTSGKTKNNTSGKTKTGNNNSGVTADKYVRHDATRYYTDEITGIKQTVHFMYVEFANEVGGGYADINTTAEMGAAHHGDAVAKLIGSNGLKIIDTSVGVSRDGNCGSFTFANLTPGNYTVELIAKDGTVVAKYHFTVKDGGKV